MKKLIGIIMSLVMLLSISTTVFAADEGTPTDELYSAYSRVVTYAEQHGISMEMSYEDFLSSYAGQPVQEYEQSFYSVFAAPQTYAGGSETYYYNTGYSCPVEATYSKYNLLDVVERGDIIYEANGGFGITGHIAIVDGIYARGDGTKYIRLIEAIAIGVVRSILDDTRVDEKAVTIMRVSGADDSDKTAAVSFCRGEVGSAYNLDFAKDTSSSETDWYCSELVWAAYKSRGVNIEVGGLHGEPGVTPRDILNGPETSSVKFKRVQ